MHCAGRAESQDNKSNGAGGTGERSKQRQWWSETSQKKKLCPDQGKWKSFRRLFLWWGIISALFCFPKWRKTPQFLPNSPASGHGGQFEHSWSQEIKGSIMSHWVPFDLYTINMGVWASQFPFPFSKVTQKTVGSLMFKESLNHVPGPLCLSMLLADFSDSSQGRWGFFISF